MENSDHEIGWLRTGAVAGTWACVAYPVAVFVPLPLRVSAVLAASFGPALAVGSVGLWRFVRLHRPSVAAAAAAGLNSLGGALFTAMVLVQLAVGHETTGHTERPLQAVWLGLDVAWDVYIGLGTLFFGLSVFRHPRLGPLFGASAIIIALGLLVTNLWTFPTPPANAGLIDLGPVLGLWYLTATVQMWRSFGWARSVITTART
jgi:hypothetical protein